MTKKKSIMMEAYVPTREELEDCLSFIQKLNLEKGAGLDERTAMLEITKYYAKKNKGCAPLQILTVYEVTKAIVQCAAAQDDLT